MKIFIFHFKSQNGFTPDNDLNFHPSSPLFQCKQQQTNPSGLFSNTKMRIQFLFLLLIIPYSGTIVLSYVNPLVSYPPSSFQPPSNVMFVTRTFQIALNPLPLLSFGTVIKTCLPVSLKLIK